MSSLPAAPPDPSVPLALVMGASRGLGLLLAEQLLARGHRVVIVSRTREDLETAADLLRRRQPGAPVEVRVCDIADREAVVALVEEVEDTLGPVEVLLTVAGTIQVGPVSAVTFEHFDEALGGMLHGPVNVTLPVVERMRGRGHGRIGTITSIGGKVAPPHLWPYATAKHGAVGFSEGLSAELAGTGVTATTVVPGLMRTGSHVRATFTGRAEHEYAWFGPAASLPLITMDARRAARRIVTGVLAGDSHVVLTPLASVGIRVNGLMPRLTHRVLGIGARLLPDAAGPGPTLEGRVAARRLDSRVVRALTVLGTRAARRNNEQP